jgi:protein-S-isoprenylcysteine O-methyltransferase Ste14
MRDVRWLTDREDPRTVLAVCVAILVFIAVFAEPMVDGGTPALWIVLVLAVALGQVAWATLRYRRWRGDREHDPS